MTLRGTDTSSYQAGIDIAKLGVDLLYAKATQGTGYVNRYCDGHIQQAIRAGMGVGVYHFANGSSATAEADHFLTNIAGYIGTAQPALDFETGVLINNSWGVAWAHEWLNRVYSRTGVKPDIYMPGWVVGAYDWTAVVNDGYRLWLAYWPKRGSDFNYGQIPTVAHWGKPDIWQFTDRGRLPGWQGNLDLDVFTGDMAAWRSHAAPTGAPKPNPAPVPDPAPTPPPAPKPSGVPVVTAPTKFHRTKGQEFAKSDHWSNLSVDQTDNGNSLIAGPGVVFGSANIAVDQPCYVSFITLDTKPGSARLVNRYPHFHLDPGSHPVWFYDSVGAPAKGYTKRVVRLQICPVHADTTVSDLYVEIAKEA